MLTSSAIHSTTVLALMHEGEVVIGADGQATMGSSIVKRGVQKLRVLNEGKVIVGFAGSTADSFTLLERLEEKLNQYGTLKRSAIELAKDWRMDRYLRRLEAMLIAVNQKEIFVLSGSGDVLEPEEHIAAIGSGGLYAQSAAMALKRHTKKLSAEDIVKESLKIAADICIYTNHEILIRKVT